MRIVFAGTPEFAVPPLQALLQSDHTICAVYTQPDRPAGRGRKLTPSPVKAVAQAAGIAVHQPESLRGDDAQAELRALGADLMVVVAYGLILPKAVIDLPRLGCINIHASLLPRWRGAAPIQRALISGDTETGVTLMFIEPRLDAGPMLSKKTCPIGPEDTAGDLHDRLARLGAEALMAALPGIESGTLQAQPQDEAGVTYAEKISKEEARLDWTQAAPDLERKVRGFNPWPVADTLYQGQPLRIWRAQAISADVHEAPGTLVHAGEHLQVATGSGYLRLQEIQLPGGRRILARDFLNAYPVDGVRLGGGA